MAADSIDMNLLPSHEEIAAYRQRGFHVSRRLFTDADLDAAIAGSERFYATLDRPQVDLPGGKRHESAWWQGSGAGALRKNDYASLLVPELAALRSKPILGAVAAALCGEDVRLWHDQLLYKPPHDPAQPTNVGWHTDYGYWRTCSSDRMLTAWIPFTEMTAAIGTLCFVEGSGHWPENDHLNFFSSDLEGLERRFQTAGEPVVKVAPALARGRVTFHDCRTIHGSGPNRTRQPRRSLAVHMQPASNHYVERRDDQGHLMRHGNDDLTRAANGLPDYADPTYCPLLATYRSRPAE